MKIIKYLFLVLSVTSLPAIATERISNATVKSIKTGANRVTFYLNDNEFINPAGCSAGYEYFEVPVGDSRDAILSILMTALATGKKVTIDVEDSPGDCAVYGAPLIKYVTLKAN